MKYRNDDPPDDDDWPCPVCGKSVDDCICPECPECGALGDPACYPAHGLERTPEQVESYRQAEEYLKAQNDAEAQWQEPPMIDLPDDFLEGFEGPEKCPHGNEWHQCDACDYLGDVAYDAAREKR